jgi:hypothetical protein
VTGTIESREACPQYGGLIRQPPATSAAVPELAYPLRLPDADGKPVAVVGSLVTGTAVPGTATVEATFDDEATKITAKTFHVNGAALYFALAKPDPEKPTWKLATVRCLDAAGTEIGKVYFQPESVLPDYAGKLRRPPTATRSSP